MKKSSFIFIPLIAIAVFTTSCEDIFNNNDGLSTSEVVEGLKTALNIGTDSSSYALSLEDGYYGNALVKIPLPDEAQTILKNVEYIEKYTPTVASAINTKMESLVLAINRSAEEAAADAKPIFADAITNLDVIDGWEILNGQVPDEDTKSETSFDSLAATKYLKNQTYSSLVDAYSPKMNSALSKDFIGDASAVDIWDEITETYNGFVSQYGNLATTALAIAGKDVQFNEVNTNIGEFVTEKALDGLFLKVGEQEKSIRRNPYQWAVDIIQSVFGSVCKLLED